MSYTFVKHLELAGGRVWKRRIGKWRGLHRSLVKSLREYAKNLEPFEERETLFRWYRNAQMDHGVKRDTKLEYLLYGRRPGVKRAHENRKRARRAFQRHHPDVDMRGLEVDHVDCNNENNDIRNLQLLTPAQHREKRCSRRKRKGLRVPANVANPSKWKKAYAEARRSVDGRWTARTTVSMVEDYEAAGGQFK
tara:strand:- start:1518 stop:2096 length:579 start_codon:yes stop_codon:yes gene_type:complete